MKAVERLILVPTDFSARAYHALLYALTLNRQINAEIELFHAYEVPLYSSEVSFDLPSATALKEQSAGSMDSLLRNITRSWPGVKFRTVLAEGRTVDEIVMEAGKVKPLMLVMGTAGASGLKEVFVGTQTEHLSQKLHCPLIAVPDEADLKEIKRIVFATCFEEDDLTHVLRLLDFFKHLHPEVILLHVKTGTVDKTFEFARISDFHDQIKSVSSYSSLTFKLLEGNDTEADLNFYLEEVKADMLVLNKRDMTFLKRLISRSLSKRMLYHTHIPVMVLHQDA